MSTVGAEPARTSGFQRRYRPELQGLRALASLLVVVFHVWVGRVSGGVDVFFLISGFLITGQAFRAAGREGIKFAPMWGRIIKRLFPAALTVLLVIMAVAVAVLPEGRWYQTIREVVASALYTENWRLVLDQVDYFAQHNTASVVQHFWSLSIQGQFYLVWPVLIAVVAVLARKARWDLRVSVLVTLLVVFVGSLTYSVVLTEVNQPLAYFNSGTRVWEFALGGIVALAGDSITMPRSLRLALGWVGVVALIACGALLEIGRVFPGYLALWPTLAAVLVLLAGSTGSRLGADWILASRPLEYLGNLSFALYLWHWPVLVFYLIIRDQQDVGMRGGAAIVALSLGLAALTYHLVETPVRDSAIGARSSWGLYRFGVVALMPVLLAAGGWTYLADRKAVEQTVALDTPDYPGAQVRTAGSEHAGSVDLPLAPPMVSLPQDWASIDQDDCRYPRPNPDLQVCSSHVDGVPQRRIVVVGDSHAQQYIAALRPIVERRNWQLISILKGACPFSTQSENLPGDQSCLDWNADAANEVVAQHPDAVLTMSSRDVRIGLTEETPAGYLEQWRKLEAAGIPVLAVRDNPRYDASPSACVELRGPYAPECRTQRADVFAPEPPYMSMEGVPRNVSFLDFSDYICPDELCPPAIGNVLLYMDESHLSASYMATMSSAVEKELMSALHW